MPLKDRCEQVDERCEQIAQGPDKRRDREPARPPATAALHATAAFPATADGARLRVPQEGQLLPAR